MLMMGELEAKQKWLEIIQEAIDKTAHKMARELSSRLSARPESEYYERTGDLVNALSNPPKAYWSGNTLVCDLIDVSLIRQTIKDTLFNAHRSLTKRNGVSPTVYDGLSIQYHALINQDAGYGLPNGGRVPGLHYISGALGTNDIEMYVNKEVEKLVIKYTQLLMKGVK